MKYKVGDKVRVVSSNDNIRKKEMIGGVYTIKKVDSPSYYEYMLEHPDANIVFWFAEHELEPVPKRGRPRKGEEKNITRKAVNNFTQLSLLTEVLDDPDKIASIIRVFIDYITRMKGQKIGVGEAHIRKFVERVFTKIKLSDQEIQLLKILPKKFRYLARNENGNLNAFTSKPRKRIENYFYHWFEDDYDETKNLKIFNDLFQFIQWDDNEPYEIAKLLEVV